MHTILSVLLFVFCFLLPCSVFSQNRADALENIKQLSSPGFFGRGYVNGGDSIAAYFIKSQLDEGAKNGNLTIDFQKFNLSVNTFPSEMEVIIDKSSLIPAVDYQVFPGSGSANGKFKIEWLTATTINDKNSFEIFKRKNFKKSIIVLDTSGLNDAGFKYEYNNIYLLNSLNAKGVIRLVDKLPAFGIADQARNFLQLEIVRNKIPEKLKSIKINVKNQYLPHYTTRNIKVVVKGQTDTMVVFSAHYDHLGQMGDKTYFPGAHDNASGVATLIDLAKYYTQQKPYYTMVFLFFAAEEHGLTGSGYFVRNPLIDLKKIKFLINLDIIGSGEKGVQIVNSTVFKNEFELLQNINKTKNYLADIKLRGPAANSDHYYFYEQGVKCFFIYTLGDYKEYHNINDKSENLPLPEYDDIFKLMIDFVTNLKNI